MPRRTALLGGALAALLPTFDAAAARAEAPIHTTTWAQEALAGIEEVEESEELRQLRLAEEELFAAGPEDAPEHIDPDCVDGAPPAPEPPASLELPEGPVDLAFLKDLKLPNIPVRWDRRVIEYLLFFKDDPRGRELAAAWVARRERYGPMVRRVLSEHGLPKDIQYLAMVESGYDPTARSAADAYGMWQFLEEPATHYGLRVDHWADERLDPERATHAAARFLRDLYDRFGSWELAFASYNMGYGGLLRAIRKYNTNDYWVLSHLEAGLPFETSLYVAKITAMALVAENPARFGLPKPVPDKQRAPAKIDVPAGTPLEEIAAKADVPLDALRAVNPHLKQARVPPGEPAVHVYLPREAQVRFAQRWTKPRPETLFVGHALRVGESLDDLAARAGMTVEALRALNALEPDAVAEPGLALLLPPGTRPTADLVEPLVASVPEKDFRYEGRRRVFYRVAQGDTGSSIARFFDVTQEELTSWNTLDGSAALQPGMLLQLFVRPEIDLAQAVVFEPGEVRILRVGSDAFYAHHEAQRGRVRVRYRVQPNDSLGSVAERFALSVGSLGRINQFPTTRRLVAGEWIIVYAPEDQLASLEKKKLVQRLGAAERAVTLRDEPKPKSPKLAARDVADDDPELPERKGEPLREPKPERPLAPPTTKSRAQVATPSKPVEKAPAGRGSAAQSKAPARGGRKVPAGEADGKPPPEVDRAPGGGARRAPAGKKREDP